MSAKLTLESIAKTFAEPSIFAILFLIIVILNLGLLVFLAYQYRVYKKKQRANLTKQTYNNDYGQIVNLKQQNGAKIKELANLKDQLSELGQKFNTTLSEIINKPLVNVIDEYLDEQFKQAANFREAELNAVLDSNDQKTVFHKRLFNKFHFGVDKLANINVKNPLNLCWVDSASFTVIESDFRKLNGVGGINKKLLIEKLRIEDIIFTNIDKKYYEVQILSDSPVKVQKTVLTIRNILINDYVDNEKIESYAREANGYFNDHCKLIGKQVLERLNIFEISPKLHKFFGLLAFRYSFGQNVLSHCLETGFLTAYLALLVNFKPDVALKCGLYHDIGKADDENGKKNHTVTGAKIGDEFYFENDVKYTIANHHNKNVDNVYCRLTQIGDKLSAGRLGARSDSSVLFSQLKQELKQIVEETLAQFKTTILLGQSGRRLVIWLETNQHNNIIDNQQLTDLATTIKSKIVQNNITNRFPIKVVLRYNFEHSFDTKDKN
ncbi:ribonuclease Y [Mycoplasmoides pneumoniae]|uniref:ribonuclease Y n=1 Tax=Mycoplasmoides pneumoniae TaxID=2104 RepID=UPI00133028CC|nr:ribonuclease Y [Mycoplasmoides pneumoniae]